MKRYEIIDISGDVGIKAYGETLKEVFANAALGMYSLITDLNAVQEQRDITVAIENPSVDSLLVAWLNELIFQFDTYGFIGKRVEITDFGFQASDSTTFVEGNQTYIKANVRGEDFDPEQHERRLLIKAATYHRLNIEKIGGAWQAEVVFDI